MKEFTSVVRLTFSCNDYEAESKDQYIQIVKQKFLNEFNIDLNDDEITEITEDDIG